MDKLFEVLKKYTNRKSIVIILIIGVVLLVLPDSFAPETKGEKKELSSLYSVDIDEYKKNIEKGLERMLSTVEGASSVSVFVTLSDFGKNTYSQEEKSETDTSSLKDTTKPILKNDVSGGQSPVLIKMELPAISGVLITAKGAQNPSVKENLTSAVRAVLGIKSSRIEVLAKKQ